MKVSNSSIQAFKQCRRMYQLRYLYGLEPIQTAEAIERGLAYHELVEGLLNGDCTLDSCENPKIRAMGAAFQTYIMPQLARESTEKWVSYKTKSGHTVVGRVDALTKDNEVVEHKTTSGPVDGDYFRKLDFDEQIPTYMLACRSNKIIYTVCAVPSIRQKKGETEEEFYRRCVDWFAEDVLNRITFVVITRDQAQLDAFADEQDKIISEMENCQFFYRNPGNCYKYGRLCEYAPVCMDYDPEQEYIEFKRREKHEEAGEAKD